MRMRNRNGENSIKFPLVVNRVQILATQLFFYLDPYALSIYLQLFHRFLFKKV